MEKNEKINLNKPEYFFNRELSWLKFNLRVLREAGVKTTPLLERLKFVAITASNLDEFFMVRVAGLWDQYENGINKRDAAGLTVKAQLEEISKAAHDQMKLLNKYLLSLVKELREAGIYICRVSELSEKGRRWLEAYYQEEIFPVLTPMAVDASRPFPFLANKTLNLAVELTNQEGEDSMGIVQVPSVLPRLLEVPGEEKRSFVFLEDVINEHCSDLYSGCKILDVVPFRITRDADLEFDEDDIDNLLKEVEKSLRKRTRGASVRLEIYNKANSRIRKFLYNNLDITEQEVYEINGPYFFGIATQFEEVMAELGDKPLVRIIRMRRVPFIDSTGVNNLSSLCRMSHKEGIRIVLSGVNENVHATLHNSGFYSLLNEENICPHINAALKRAQNIINSEQ